MKYAYAYKTSDGTRHEAAMDAPSREAVFEALRASGIKAIKVVAADGSRANGEVRGVRKRAVAVGAACLVICAICGMLLSFRAGTHAQESQPANQLLSDTTRRQVIGDAAIIKKGIRTGWAAAFTREGDRFFASFAIPGVGAGVRSTSVEKIEEALRTSVAVSPSDDIEIQQIKAMVEGMKQEARKYLADGGSIVEYGKRLTERQDAEIAAYERVESDIRSAQKRMPEREFSAFYERRNDELRNLGIRPVTLPD